MTAPFAPLAWKEWRLIPVPGMRADLLDTLALNGLQFVRDEAPSPGMTTHGERVVVVRCLRQIGD